MSYLIEEEAQKLLCPWMLNNADPNAWSTCQASKCAAWVWRDPEPKVIYIVVVRQVEPEWVDVVKALGIATIERLDFKGKPQITIRNGADLREELFVRPPEVGPRWSWFCRETPLLECGWVEDEESAWERRAGRCRRIPLPEEGETL